MVACFITNRKKRLEIINSLLNHGSDPILTDSFGRNSYMYACGLSLEKEVMLLIKDTDCDLNATDLKGDTLLHICAKTGKVDILRIVLKEMKRYNMDISVQNKMYFTPLSLAILNGFPDCARKLHEAGASPRFTESCFNHIMLKLEKYPRNFSSVDGSVRSIVNASEALGTKAYKVKLINSSLNDAASTNYSMIFQTFQFIL